MNLNGFIKNKKLKEIMITAFVYLSLDIIYLKSNTKVFQRYFKRVQMSRLTFKTNPAIVAYVLLVLGLYYFIIKDRRPLTDAFILGVLIYGVYDFTNYATLKRWTFAFSMQDMLWGGTVFTISTFIIYKILGHI